MNRSISRRQLLMGAAQVSVGSALAIAATTNLAVAADAASMERHRAGGARSAARRSGAYATPGHTNARNVSIKDIQAAFAHNRYTVADLVGYYVARIRAIDQNGPALHAILELNPDWAEMALGYDLKSIDPPTRGALFGVPVVLKDNIDTADRMHTTAGSLALLGSRPRQDAFIVRRLRQAGALILAKANMAEWAGMRTFSASSSWSGRGGLTRNPYAPERSPSGSSSGPAVAVAADLGAVGIGTDTGGSIAGPASVNGVVGVRPTVGLVSRSGIVPISKSQDTAGPLTRTVADAAAVLTVIAGYDPDDPTTARFKDQPPPDFRRALKKDSLKGARIGVLREYAGFNADVDRLFDRALATLRAQGATLVDPVSVPSKGQFDDDSEVVQEYEFKDGIARYLATRIGPGPKNLADLIAFNTQHASAEMPYFGQSVFLSSERKGALTDSVYLNALERERRLAGPEGIDAALRRDRLDALIAPTSPPAPLIDLVAVNRGGGGSGHFTLLAAAAGYPRTTVPMGLVRGLPVGLTFVGTAWSEFKLIGLAYGFEQASHARRLPGETPVALPDGSERLLDWR